MVLAVSTWGTVAIGFAGVVLGFVLTEVSDYFRRKRETRSAARLVFQELTSAYSDADAVWEGLVESADEVPLRRTAWDAHAAALVRPLSVEDSHRIAAGYSSIDNLKRVLSAGAPAEVFTRPEERKWLEDNILGDLERALVVVGKRAGHSEKQVRDRIRAAQERRRLQSVSGKGEGGASNEAESRS